MTKILLTLEELVHVAVTIEQYQQEHGRDYTLTTILRKLNAYVGDIRVAPVRFALYEDAESLDELGVVE